MNRNPIGIEGIVVLLRFLHNSLQFSMCGVHTFFRDLGLVQGVMVLCHSHSRAEISIISAYPLAFKAS